MTTVDECAQAILNEWRQVEPASAHVLAHMAARIAAARFGDAVVRPTRDQIAEAIATMLWAEYQDVVGPTGARKSADKMGQDVADAVLGLFGVAVSDSQPVRPTRADVVAQTQLEFCWLDDEYRNVIREIVDFLVARGWLAVSESQETPTL